MSEHSALVQAFLRGRTAVRVGLVVSLLTFLPGAAFADDARRLRLEAAALVQAAENSELGSRERQALLEQAHDKLVEIQERFPSASAEFQVFRGGKRVHWSPDDVRRAARVAARLAPLSSPEVGRLRDVLGREISPSAVDENGWTDLHWAAALNLPELAKALLDTGADVAAAVHHDAEPLSDRLKQSMNELGLDVKFSRKGYHGGYHPSHIAAFADAKEVLAVLFAAGAEVDAKASQNDWTLLHAAAYADSNEVAPVLIERGADLNAKSNTGLTPLHLAARHNSLDVAAILIERGADVNAKSNRGLTPLHTAARYNSLDVAAILIERGVAINAKDEDGETPLHVATRNNASEVAALLNKRQKDIENRLASMDVGKLREVLGRSPSPTAVDENGWTDLHWAAVLNLPEMAEALLDAGADVEARLKDDQDPFSDSLMQALGRFGIATVSRRYGSTPLIRAAMQDASGTAALLIERGADIHAKDNIFGGTPLHWAALNSYSGIAALLIERGADIHAKSIYGDTPLSWAAMQDASGTAALLIERGADIHAKNEGGETPLLVAAERNRQRVLVLLNKRQKDIENRLASMDVGKLREVLGRSPSPTAVDENGWTDLHWAAVLNLPEVVEALLDAGADVEARLKDDEHSFSDSLMQALEKLWPVTLGIDKRNGSTPLHWAAGRNASEAAALLIERGADIHAKHTRGSTPLHWAALFNASGTAALLIERGADIYAKNNFNSTPLRFATSNYAYKVAALLRKHGARR